MSTGSHHVGPPELPTGPTSQDLAAPSRRARRRARDRRALVAALITTVAAAGVLLVTGWIFIQRVPEKEPQALVAPELPLPGEEDLRGPGGPPKMGAAAAELPSRRPGVVSTPLDETPDLPALRRLQDEGLTLGAEGLPDIRGRIAPQTAGLLSCRFAYGVWELSPNQRFRFLTTCGHEEGRIWVGAYAVRGTQVVTSPLSAEGATWTTVFELQKPTRVTTQLESQAGAVEIRQKLTAVTPGLNGDGFHATYRDRNQLQVREGGPGSAAPPASPSEERELERSPERDPLLDLLNR